MWTALVHVETYLKSEIVPQISTSSSFGGEDMKPVIHAYQIYRDLQVQLPPAAAQSIREAMQKLQSGLNRFLDLMRKAVENRDTQDLYKQLIIEQLQTVLESYQQDIEIIAIQLASKSTKEVITGVASIFLSYRRSDTGMLVGRIVEYLRNNGIVVFYDIDTLYGGTLWKDHIRSSIEASTALVCLIGENWELTRLKEADDPVRAEIEFALQIGKPVIPILVGHAILPTEESLPPIINRLRDYHANRLDYGEDFSIHINRIIEAIQRFAGD